MHARVLGHSTFETHSGRQFGGAPMYSLRHEQDGVSPTGLHSEFGPQGDGWHGLMGSLEGNCSTIEAKA